MTKDEALKMALKVLIDNREDVARGESDKYMTLQYDQTIAAIKEALAQRKPNEAIAAVKTLERLGYTYHGAELWKPPLGKPLAQPKPLFADMIAEIPELAEELAAIKIPQPEPVAWAFQNKETGQVMGVDAQQVKLGFEKSNPCWVKKQPLYPLQPEQEPVAWVYKSEPSFDGNKWHDTFAVTTSKQVALWKDKTAKPLYTTPPQPEPEIKPLCPDCKAEVLYECVACSCNNYPKAQP